MAKTKYKVELNASEKNLLRALAEDINNPERMRMRAAILLMSDSPNGEKMSIAEVAERLGTTHTTVQTVRKMYAMEGIEAAVERKTRTVSTKSRKLNEDVIEELLKISKEKPPEGKKKWTIRLLEKEMVKRKIVDSISISAIAKILKKQAQETE